MVLDAKIEILEFDSCDAAEVGRDTRPWPIAGQANRPNVALIAGQAASRHWSLPFCVNFSARGLAAIEFAI
jgi:hypothetical protein